MIMILNHHWSAWQAKFNFVYICVLLPGLFNLKTKYDESDNVMVRASRVVTDKLQDIFSKWTVFHPSVTTYCNFSKLTAMKHAGKFELDFETAIKVGW